MKKEWVDGIKNWRISPITFRRLSYTTLVFLAIIIVTGGAVRLSQSGLGCPTWPNCTANHLVATDSFHPMVEFVNRLITIGASVIVMASALAAFLRKPFRKDLAWLAMGLVGGLIAEIILGGLTVLAKLAPPYVMAHFILAILIVWNAIVLYVHSASDDQIPIRRVSKETVLWGRMILVVLGAVIFVGTAVTGSGPHSGSPIAQRLPFKLRDVAQLHADIVWLLIGLTLIGLLLLKQSGAPEDVQKAARFLLIMEALQGAIGYTQYFTNLPALLVGFHIAGATVVWMTALWVNLQFFERGTLEDEATRAKDQEGNAFELSKDDVTSASDQVKVSAVTTQHGFFYKRW